MDYVELLEEDETIIIQLREEKTKENDKDESCGLSLSYLPEEYDYIREALKHAKERMTKRENIVLEYRFGYLSGVPHTLEETANEFRITTKRVRQIEAKLLRNSLASRRRQYLKDYLNDDHSLEMLETQQNTITD